MSSNSIFKLQVVSGSYSPLRLQFRFLCVKRWHLPYGSKCYTQWYQLRWLPSRHTWSKRPAPRVNSASEMKNKWIQLSWRWSHKLSQFNLSKIKHLNRSKSRHAAHKSTTDSGWLFLSEIPVKHNSRFIEHSPQKITGWASEHCSSSPHVEVALSKAVPSVYVCVWMN